MSHSHRDDFDVVAPAESVDLGLEEQPAPALASNAAVARDAEVARAPVEREHAFTVGGDDVAAPPASSWSPSASDDDDGSLRRSGVPAPRYVDCRGERSWARSLAPAPATLRTGDDWLDTYGALPAQLSDRATKWTR